MNLYLRQSWCDKRMGYDPLVYSDKHDELQIPTDQLGKLWIPHLYIKNKVEENTYGSEHTLITVNATGYVWLSTQ